jgi:rod shape-determining protein MreC
MKDKTRIAIYIASAAAVLLLISTPYSKNMLGSLSGVREGFYWIEGMVKAPFTFSSRIFNNYIWLVGTKKENILLKKNLNELKTRQMLIRDIKSENTRLKVMLGMKEDWADYPLYGAKIISQDISLMFKSVIINRGTAQGFYVDMPVISTRGLAGRVISASENTSQVLLLTDVNSAVPALVENSRIKGIIKGLGSGKLNFDYVRSDEEIKIGDRIITSGLLEIFPKGIFIGTVRSIKRLENKMFAEIIVSSAFDANKAEEVFGIGRIPQKKR